MFQILISKNSTRIAVGYENLSIREAQHPMCPEPSCHDTHLHPAFSCMKNELEELLLLPALCHCHRELSWGIQAGWGRGSAHPPRESPGPCPEEQERQLGVLDPRSICTCTQIALAGQMASYKTTCSHQQCSKHFLLETCFLSGTCRWFPSPTCKFSKIHLLNWLLCNLHMLRFDCEYLKLAIFLK